MNHLLFILISDIDLNMFHVDYERLMEVLITIVVLAFFVERALSVVFESRLFIEWNDGIKLPTAADSEGVPKAEASVEVKPGKKKKGVKEIVSLAVSVSVCFVTDFDAVTIIMMTGSTATTYGIVLTGAIIAGGSKASIVFFKDVMGFMSTAEKHRKALKDAAQAGAEAKATATATA